MPALIASVLTVLSRYLLARVLVGAGLTVVTYTAINSLVERLKDMLQGYLNDLPQSVVYVVDLLNFDFYLAIVISAYSLAITIKSAKIFIGKA